MLAQGGVGRDLTGQPVDHGEGGPEVHGGVGHLATDGGDPGLGGDGLVAGPVVTAARGHGQDGQHHPDPRPSHGAGRYRSRPRVGAGGRDARKSPAAT